MAKVGWGKDTEPTKSGSIRAIQDQLKCGKNDSRAGQNAFHF